MPGPRVAYENIQVNGYTIQKGTGIFFNMDPVFKDNKFWGDPENFRPERFLVKKDDGTGGYQLQTKLTERVAAFGFGRRICVGESLAWNTLFLFITTMIRTYKMNLIQGMEYTFEPVVGGTCIPQKYTLKFTKRTTL